MSSIFTSLSCSYACTRWNHASRSSPDRGSMSRVETSSKKTLGCSVLIDSTCPVTDRPINSLRDRGVQAAEGSVCRLDWPSFDAAIFCLSNRGRKGVSPIAQPGFWNAPGRLCTSASPGLVPWQMDCQPACTALICFQPWEVLAIICSSFSPSSWMGASLYTSLSASTTSAAAFFCSSSSIEGGWFWPARARNSIAGETMRALEGWRRIHWMAVFTPCRAHTCSRRAWSVHTRSRSIRAGRRIFALLENLLQKLSI
mmetsp:Transcript_32166/g.70873  ORF Transcript_32166/g.70873 Transcript_32166/m.70873 type:complete len:256 (+) Transcript_32166:240-1007(+)